MKHRFKLHTKIKTKQLFDNQRFCWFYFTKSHYYQQFLSALSLPFINTYNYSGDRTSALAVRNTRSYGDTFGNSVSLSNIFAGKTALTYEFFYESKYSMCGNPHQHTWANIRLTTWILLALKITLYFTRNSYCVSFFSKKIEETFLKRGKRLEIMYKRMKRNAE